MPAKWLSDSGHSSDVVVVNLSIFLFTLKYMLPTVFHLQVTIEI